MSKRSALIKKIQSHDEPHTGNYVISVAGEPYKDLPNPDGKDIAIEAVNEATADTFLRLTQGR